MLVNKHRHNWVITLGGVKSTMGVRISDASILCPVTRRHFIFFYTTQIIILKMFLYFFLPLSKPLARKKKNLFLGTTNWRGVWSCFIGPIRVTLWGLINEQVTWNCGMGLNSWRRATTKSRVWVHQLVDTIPCHAKPSQAKQSKIMHSVYA